VVVAGSNPVSRSRKQDWGVGGLDFCMLFTRCSFRLTPAFGGIAKWLRQRSAKPLFTGSNPVAASRKFKGLAGIADPFFVYRYRFHAHLPKNGVSEFFSTPPLRPSQDARI
jgi:hypothetical protein